MTQAPHDRKIIEQCYRERRKLPQAISGAPELIAGLELYYNAFFDLSTSRNQGMGIGRIPWTAIKDYGECFELSAEQMDDLFYFVRAMDNAYLEHYSKKKGAEGEWQNRTASKPSRLVYPFGRKRS